MIKAMVSSNLLWLAMMIVNLLLSNIAVVLPDKHVMRVDYKAYLRSKYKVYNVSYQLIKTVLSMLSILALLWLVMPNETIRLIYFFILSFVTVCHIYMAIRYDVFLHANVKKDIYMSEFTGLYFAYENINAKYTDMSVKNAVRSEKELSPDVIKYFDSYNSQTIKVFKEIFGEDSFLYDRSDALKKYYQRHYDNIPCEYQTRNGVYHMPYEFIELFQSSVHQKEWAMELLKLLNGEDHTIDNLVLLLASVRVMGQQKKLFSLNFLLEIKPYILDIARENVIKVKIPSRIVRENKLLRELQLYIQMTLDLDNSVRFYREAIDLYIEFFNAHGYMSHQECMAFVNYLLDQASVMTECRNKDFILEFCEDYIQKNSYKEKNSELIVERAKSV